jgi:hypothetical protein
MRIRAVNRVYRPVVAERSGVPRNTGVRRVLEALARASRPSYEMSSHKQQLYALNPPICRQIAALTSHAR